MAGYPRAYLEQLTFYAEKLTSGSKNLTERRTVAQRPRLPVRPAVRGSRAGIVVPMPEWNDTYLSR